MKLPTQEQKNFGREKYEEGYAAGYQRALWDHRKSRLCKERNSFFRFGQFWDYLGDICEQNRKK